MLVILRVVFGGALFYGIVVTRRYAAAHPESGDVMGAFHLAVCVLLAIVNALVWAPYFGAKISEPITGTITKSTYVERRNYLLRLIYWVRDRGWRRCAALLCFLEGIHHPDQPTAFVIGLKSARPGSWLEKVYAREVFKFDNAQNCLQAFAVLRKHGVDPRPHHNPEVNLLLMTLERTVQPEPVKVAVPPAPEPPEVQRNPRIRLFETDPGAKGD
ncbi:MAG: hypothetical protein HY735_04725 [Verrucomicrobia bacterium]|nr:hypothetical protein [Verrucomicrobiota bacterium]